MSPYRVVVSDNEEVPNKAVLSAMISKPDADGDYDIYITHKANLKIVDEVGNIDYESMAYRMTTRFNSTIVGNYKAVKEGNKYSVVKLGSKYAYSLGTSKQTLSACLKAAMEHFCEIHSLHIDTVFN